MSLKDYHAEKRLQLEFHEWHSLAGEMASAGELPVEKQIRFEEITNKLAVIADAQVPPINPEALSRFVGLDPVSPPHVKTRYALYSEAFSVWSRIRAARGRTRKPPKTAATGANSKAADNKKAACVGHYMAAIVKGKTPPSNDELSKLVGCDRTLAYKATRALRARTKGAMQSEASDRQEKKTGKMNRATKNGDLGNMAKNSSRDDD